MLIIKEFRQVPVDEEIARESAILRLRFCVPMADSIIAATGKMLGAPQ